jgi:phospholipid/cholesterol/gamma-HCH transport system substrate-binding protein
MPAKTKVTWARLKVGLFTMAAMTILAVAIFLVTGDRTLFEGHETIYTYLDDSAALAEGAPVTLNGITIGKVQHITLSGLPGPEKQVKVEMVIRDRYRSKIPVDSVTALSAANLLGTKFINITRGKSKEVVRDGGTLPSLNTAEFEDVVKQGYSILASLQLTVQQVNDIVGQVESGKGSIGQLLVNRELYDRLNNIAKQVEIITTALNTREGTLGQLLYRPDMYNDVRGSMKRVDSLLEELQQGKGTAGKFLKDPAVYDELQGAVKDTRRILEQVQSGKGTAGKLLYSQDLHDQLLVTLGKLDETLDQMNSGRGTIGQLLRNPELYDSLNGSSKELHAMLKDFRTNPKKFLRIKLALF